MIKVGYIDYDGFITEEKDGTYTGYGVEYLRKIAEDTGWEYKFEYDSWDRQLKKLETGEIDMNCQTQRTKERLFLPFEQEETQTAQHHGESVLGLSIAKNLVELMSGSIACQPKKGVGTTFTVSLPLAHAADEKEQKADETGEKEEEAEESYDFGGRRILLAEDTEMNVEIVTELLELVNMHVDHAWNGREAVQH